MVVLDVFRSEDYLVCLPEDRGLGEFNERGRSQGCNLEKLVEAAEQREILNFHGQKHEKTQKWWISIAILFVKGTFACEAQRYAPKKGKTKRSWSSLIHLQAMS